MGREVVFVTKRDLCFPLGECVAGGGRKRIGHEADVVETSKRMKISSDGHQYTGHGQGIKTYSLSLCTAGSPLGWSRVTHRIPL